MSRTSPDTLGTVATLTKTRFTLEMTAPSQLVPARGTSRITFRATTADDPELPRLFSEVGGPHRWSLQRWNEGGPGADQRHWVIEVDSEPAGLLTLLGTGDQVEIGTFGLVPARQGLGLGGFALTLAVRLAWTAYGDSGRVWLHTSTFDHPRALSNYLARGFVEVERVTVDVEVPDGWSPPALALPVSPEGAGAP